MVRPTSWRAEQDYWALRRRGLEYRDPRRAPGGLIDWETAGPVDPMIELAQACWLNAKLFGDDVAEREGLPSLEVRARQLRAIVDAYGLSTTQRRGLVDRIIGYAIHDTAEQAYASGVTLETVDPMPDGFPDHLGTDLACPVRSVDIPQSRHVGESNQVVVAGEMASQVHLKVRWRRYTSSTRWDAFHRSTRPDACQALRSRPR